MESRMLMLFAAGRNDNATGNDREGTLFAGRNCRGCDVRTEGRFASGATILALVRVAG